ncbi:hypothetical protein V8F20_001449 [Naviculisporaceae sp. PSN 640]
MEPLRCAREELPPAAIPLGYVLDQYRAHITARNHEAIKVYVDLIEKCPPPPNTPSEIRNSPDRIRKIRLASLCKLLGVRPPIMDAYISSSVWLDDVASGFNFMAEEPSVVLKYWKFLPERLGVDGVMWRTNRHRLFKDGGGKRDGDAYPRPVYKPRLRSGQHETEELVMPEDYFEIFLDEIEKELKLSCVPKVKTSIKLPEELKHLVLLGVEGLDGPGFGIYKFSRGALLWAGIWDCLKVEDLDDPEGYQPVVGELVKDARTETATELEVLAGLDKHEWIVGGGFLMGGDGATLNICALYVAPRLSRPDFGPGSPPTKEYSWLFTVTETEPREAYHEEFVSIKKLMKWGMRCREERFLVDPDKIRASVTDEDIWLGKW